MKKIGIIVSMAAVFLILLSFGGFSGYKYYSTVYLPEKNIRDAYIAENDIFEAIAPHIEDILSYDDNSSKNLLTACTNVNNDTVGWIVIPDTNINYPVMQCDDNDFYLHNGVDGNYNYELGCPFLDFRCEADLSGFNSIVYGHHMDQGRMFADIVLYDDESFFCDHDVGYLVLPNEVKKIEFFSFLCVSSNSPIYNTVFLSASEREDYIDLLFSDAKYTQKFTSNELKEKDDLHFLLMSTCTFGEGDLRSVLVGVF